MRLPIVTIIVAVCPANRQSADYGRATILKIGPELSHRPAPGNNIIKQDDSSAVKERRVEGVLGTIGPTKTGRCLFSCDVDIREPISHAKRVAHILRE